MTGCENNTKENRLNPLEGLLDLLSIYSSSVLTDQLLADSTGGELTSSQLQGLTFIRQHDGCSVKALSEGLYIAIPSATRMVDRLVRKNLVTRCENASDRRLVQLAATAAGMAVLLKVRAAHLALVQQALSTLSPAEQAQLLALLERFLMAALCDETALRQCCRHCGIEHDGDCLVNEAHKALLGRAVTNT